MDYVKPDNSRLIALMREERITEASCSFSGGNDEGCIEGFAILLEGEEEPRLLDYDDYSIWQKLDRGNAMEPHEEICAILYQNVLGQYYSFAGEFQVNGDIVATASDGRVREISNYAEMAYVNKDIEL